MSRESRGPRAGGGKKSSSTGTGSHLSKEERKEEKRGEAVASAGAEAESARHRPGGALEAGEGRKTNARRSGWWQVHFFVFFAPGACLNSGGGAAGALALPERGV